MKPSDAASARRDRELSDLKRRVDEGIRVLRRQQRRRLDAPTLADVDEDEDRIKRMIEGTLLLEEVLKRSVPPPDDEAGVDRRAGESHRPDQAGKRRHHRDSL